MSLWPRRVRTGTPIVLARHMMGNALVVHPTNVISAESQLLAMTVAPDDEHDLVVLDLPGEPPIEVWESVAALLPRGRRGIRLVVSGRSREAIALAGQWLAELLGRPVTVPDGVIVPGTDGSLFVDSGQDSGWVRCEPGRPSVVVGKRFPQPHWDAAAMAETLQTSARFVVEPIPAGLWVRPVEPDGERQHGRSWLIRTVPCQPDVLTVVLGTPRCPASVDDAAAVWMRLPEHVRPSVRFAQFGDSSASLLAFGQELADLMDTRVACFAGMPVGVARPPAVFTVRSDGQLGWPVFAREIAYEPGSSVTGRATVLLSHRRPLPGLEEIEPAVYRYAPDAVIEIIQGGLWVRSPQGAVHAGAVRATRLASAVNRVVFDEVDGSGTVRLERLAEDVMAQLDPHLRQMTEVVSVSAFLAEPAPGPMEQHRFPAHGGASRQLDAGPMPGAVSERRSAAVHIDAPTPSGKPRIDVLHGVAGDELVLVPPPAEAAELAATEVLTPRGLGVSRAHDVLQDGPPGATTHREAEPTARLGGVRLQRTPDVEASALTTGRLDLGRRWLRDDLGTRYATMAASVAAVLSENIGFQGIRTRSGDDVVTDAVAVRLYLSWEGDGIDDALRRGVTGPHVPFARCVAAGLRRLPSHRGPSVFAASPTSDELRMLRTRPVLAEWGFLNALTAPCAVAGGTFDVLVWSMTARRTALLEPDGGQTEDRVLFLPGSRFKVLIMVEPSEGTRGQLLLRELTTSEVDAAGQVGPDPGAMDDLAVTSLRRQADLWATERPRRRIGVVGAERFGVVPGVVTTT